MIINPLDQALQSKIYNANAPIFRFDEQILRIWWLKGHIVHHKINIEQCSFKTSFRTVHKNMYTLNTTVLYI